MRKRDLVVIGREQSLTMAVDLVHAGMSVDVVGSRGSGRSAFLAGLRARLEESEWAVVAVRGIASLRQHPLAALHLAGVGSPTSQRPSTTLQETANALRAQVARPHSVVFLDDWDDLDESTWGVAESIRRSSGVPIVLSRLQGLRARHTPSGLEASTLESAYVIDMLPLKFDELEKVLAEYLHGPLESGTMSRIYAKSGGNIGLALSLVDATMREGRMSRSGSGAWAATRDLWSPGLRAVVEAHLENLGDDARDALEIIALVGVADIDTVRTLVDWGTLEVLEERAMIALVPSGARQLVTVVPPLLVEFFRHEPLVSRRIRLTELIVERLGTTENLNELLANLNSRPTPEHDALFVRLLRERARTRRIVTSAEWQRDKAPATAVRYVSALLHTNAPHDQVADVLAQTDAEAGDQAGRADYAILKANWTAYVLGDVDAALVHLSSAAASLSVYRRMLDAAGVCILTNLRGIPDDFAARLEVTEDLPNVVRLALLETQMLVLLNLGRFADVRRIFASMESSDERADAYFPRVLNGLAMLGDGDYVDALAWLLRGVDEAHGYLDIEAARAYGAAAALCLMLSGNYEAVDGLLETLFAAGDTPSIPPGSQLGLLTAASVVAVRRGHVSLGERYAAEIEALPMPDGPLPGQSKVWSQVQILTFNGKAAAAADLLWNSSLELWDRGARFAGALGMLAAVEIHLDADRLTFATERANEIGGGLLLSHVAYLVALNNRNAMEMRSAAKQLEDSGRIGLAIGALRLAETWHHDANEPHEESATRSEQQSLIRRVGADIFDTARFAASAVTLTDRELEVANLAAEGLSNPEIATRLVLSVRTVESHMHRIMRKLDVRNRQGLRRYLTSSS
jgi:DNA-binding CsgD family transcriptional regulator